MTNSQLYLVIGMAFLLALLVITHSVWLLAGVSGVILVLHLLEHV